MKSAHRIGTILVAALLVHRFLETNHMKGVYHEGRTRPHRSFRYDSNFGNAVLVSAFAGTPAIAQQNEVAALSDRIIKLYQAGKFAEAIPLARRALAIQEKAQPATPSSRTRSLLGRP